MLQQIGRLLRHAVFLHVRGCGAEHAPQRKQAPLDQRIVDGRENLEHHVEPLGNRVDHAVVDHHVELDIGVLRAEPRQRLGKMAERVSGQHADAQFASGRGAQAAHLVGEVRQHADGFGALLVVGLAHFGQAHVPRAAVKQRRFNKALQLLHAVGDHRVRHAQLAGGLGKAARFRHAHEGFNTEKTVHFQRPCA
jgi:hypothetical protein